MNAHSTRAVVLAAGRSTRFRTKKTKLLFSICGQTMILYPLRVLESLGIPTTLVLGYQGDTVKQELQKTDLKDLSFVFQKEQLGTGHAVACTQETWDKDHIMILYGDMPLLTKELVQQLISEHAARNATITFFTSYVIDPTGYGRIIENNGKFQIIEEKDCVAEQRYINRINAGIYLIKKSFLDEYITKLTPSPVTGEIYLPELIRLAGEANLLVHAISVPYDNVRGVNTLQELWSVEQIKRSEFIKHWMSRGVRFELAQSIHLDIDIEIGAGTFIGTGVHLLGKTRIGEDCFIGAFSIIENATIDNGTMIHSHSVIQQTHIGCHASIGPFARLRNNSRIGDGTEIGNFVEMKNSSIGNHSKTRHLSYISNAEIGSNVKLGPSLITCNFNGTQEHKTIIEDNVFIEGNNTLLAPLRIGKGAYVAAGSTISHDVPAGACTIARSQQIIQPNTDQATCKAMCCDAGQEDETTIDANAKKDTVQFTGATKTKDLQKAEF